MLSFLLAISAANPVVLGLSSPTDTVKIHLPVRVEQVRDLRRLGKEDPKLLGVTEIGLFEQRTALTTPTPVADEVKALVRSWTISDSNALPVRLELLSLETWPVMVPGPDPVRSRVMFRVVSLDSAKPGLILVPEATAENKGFQSGEDQMSLVRGGIRDALAMLRGDIHPAPDASTPVAPQPDTAADPRRIPVQDSVPTGVRHALWVNAAPGFQTLSMALRYSQFLTPQAGWTDEYWAAVQARGPWTSDDFTNVWAGDAMAGRAWWRHLDDGHSPWALVGSLGALIGTETFARVYPDSNGGSHRGRQARYYYLGGQGRGGIRWVGSEGWVAEGGLELDLRLPSVIAWFDPGAYLQVGWQF